MRPRASMDVKRHEPSFPAGDDRLLSMDTSTESSLMKTLSFQVLPVEPYTHIGAVIVDAVQQAGLNYDNVVRKRVGAVAPPGAPSDSSSCWRPRAPGGLSWSPGRKPRLVVGLAEYRSRGRHRLRPTRPAWRPENLPKLTALHGVGRRQSTISRFSWGFR
jgi:hypothetical protein